MRRALRESLYQAAGESESAIMSTTSWEILRCPDEHWRSDRSEPCCRPGLPATGVPGRSCSWATNGGAGNRVRCQIVRYGQHAQRQILRQILRCESLHIPFADKHGRHVGNSGGTSVVQLSRAAANPLFLAENLSEVWGLSLNLDFGLVFGPQLL